MPLAMSRSFRHSKTGVYYLRKRVPADLRRVVGTEFVKTTLRTKDPVLAKELFLKALSKLERQWANMRLGEQELTEREAHKLANGYYETWIQANLEEPSKQALWSVELYERLWTEPSDDLRAMVLEDRNGLSARDATTIFLMRGMCVRFAKSCLEKHGLSVNDESKNKLEKAIAAALQRASLSIARMAKGYNQNVASWRPVENEKTVGSKSEHDSSFEDLGPTKSALRNNKSQSLKAILDAWWLENSAAGLKASTYENYRNTISQLIKFLGHEDAGQITKGDIVAFKNHRLTTPSAKTRRVASAKTIKDGDLTALKSLFGWAVANGFVDRNPAAGITIKIPKKQILRPKGFSDTEAKALLSAARVYRNPNEFSGTSAAKRWVPWLCAHTGARVGEIAQLRRQDVFEEGGFSVIRITPEAGTVKDNKARVVVLHRQIVEEGFLDFAKKAKDGYLFLRVKEPKNFRGPLRGLKNRLAEFARTVVTDRHVAPNHGWRHRFKTVGIEAEIAPRVLDAIQGQAPRTVAETYGEVTLKSIAAAMVRMPAFDV